MRADRLISALMLLQSRGQITAAELGAELEVSERTARRDLEALAISGVPVYSQAGRGGGWRLVGGARTNLTGLSEPESRALFLALSQLGDQSPVLEAALRKLIVAIPDRFRRDAQAAVGAIRVDPTGWGQVRPIERPSHVDALSQAVIDGHQCRMTYQRPDQDEPNDRLVHPLGLVTKRGVWYLVANTDRGMRTYRVSRVTQVQALEAAVEIPEDFDLEREWDRIVTAVESRRNDVAVRLRFDQDKIGPIHWVFRNRVQVHDPGSDGRIEATVTDSSAQAMATQLAGFAPSVEFIDIPDDVAAQLSIIAAALDPWRE